MILWDQKTIKASLTGPEARVLIVMIESRDLNLEFQVSFHKTSMRISIEKTDRRTVGRWTSGEAEP